MELSIRMEWLDWKKIIFMRAKLINHYFPLIVRKGIKIYDGLLSLYKLYDVLNYMNLKELCKSYILYFITNYF